MREKETRDNMVRSIRRDFLFKSDTALPLTFAYLLSLTFIYFWKKKALFNSKVAVKLEADFNNF